MFATAVLAASVAVAEPPPERWYGWQFLAGDVASVALIGGGVYLFLVETEGWWAVTGLGLATYAGVSPAIHAANGNEKMAWPAFVLRFGLTTGVGLATFGAVRVTASCSDSDGETARHCRDREHGWEPMLYAAGAAAIGAVVATSIDMSKYAWTTAPVAVVPRFDPWTRTASVSLGTAF